MRSLIYKIVTVLFIFLSYGISTLHAQIPVNDFAQIEANTTNPRPFQNITIKATSYSTDLNRATLTWSVNKKVAASGIGVTSFSVTTGATGSTVTVDVSIKTAEGMNITKTISFTPAEVDLVWEASGITPPFYKGMPIFTHQGDLVFTAIPNLIDKKGNRLDPAKLLYTWKLNYKVLGESSGYGKQRLEMKGGPLIRETIVGVLVTDPSDNSLHAESAVSLDAHEPEILFYEDNPLYGVLYNKAVTNPYNLKTSEVKLLSVPYFFSKSSKDSLQYSWSINNLERDDLKDTSSITLRAQGDTEGSSLIGLEIKNLKDIFQTANTSFTVNFTKQGGAAVQF